MNLGAGQFARLPRTLSEYERLALGSRINLSDGHARAPLTESQSAILELVPALYERAMRTPQEEIEVQFLRSFFECAKLALPTEPMSTFLTFSSSSAIKMVAQYCRLQNLRVHLIEPCFDNIVHLLNTEGVYVEPVKEDKIADLKAWDAVLDPRAVVWIVQPNNPTGFCLSSEQMMALFRHVAEAGATIVVDFCFRMFADDLRRWDQYNVLRDSGVHFICIEDTGKTWAIADTKVGITVCSGQPAKVLYRLHDELLLNVSPLHLLLIAEFIKNTLALGRQKSILDLIEHNRREVIALVDEGLLDRASIHCRNVPMELLALRGAEPAVGFWRELRDRGVDVLPASRYYWSDMTIGEKLFRIPLSRPKADIAAAIPIIRQTVSWC